MRRSACLVLLALGLSTAVPAAQPPRTPESAVTVGPSRHTGFMAEIKAAKGDIGLLLIGDSITDFWPKNAKESYAAFAPWKPLDIGVSGEKTENVLWRLVNGELAGYHPKAAMIMIGTNNLGHYADEKPEWVAAGVAKIIDTVRDWQPDTKILLLAIFPRGKPGDPIKERVDATNALISKLDDGKTVRFLDIGAKFLTPQGTVSPALLPDYLHPNPAGYKVWLEAVKPVLTEMMK